MPAFDPDVLTPYAHGAAGHQGISSNASGSLLIKPCTQAEIDFYESAKQYPEFQAHMPTFIGSLTQNEDATISSPVQGGKESTTKDKEQDSKDEEQTGKGDWVPSGGKQLSTGLAIVLENATTGFKRPNVLDLKLGSRLWDDNAPEAKRRKLDAVANETTSGSLGFRVAGMKTWIGEEPPNTTVPEPNTTIHESYKSYDKFYGRTLTPETVPEAFISFLGGYTHPTTRFRRPRALLLLKRLLRELKSIQYVLETTESRMYSASVLVVAEADDDTLETALTQEEEEFNRAKEQILKTAAEDEDNNGEGEEEEEEEDDEDEDEDEDEENTGPKVLEVRLIDFAHASWTPGLGPDQNALRGVKSIRTILEQLLDSTTA